MTKQARRHVVLLLLPLLAMTLGASQAATLTVAPTQVYLGERVTITAVGFGNCKPDVVRMRRLASITLESDPPGIELPSIAVEEGSSVTVTVSPDAAPGPYTITASCPRPSPVTASADLTVLVEDQPASQPSSGAANPADQGGNGGEETIGTAGDTPQTPSDVVPPDSVSPASGNARTWLLVPLGLGLVLLLAGFGVQRWLVKRPPAVTVMPVAGVAVGPRVRARTPEHDGVRLVPRADPGTRVVSTSGRDEGGRHGHDGR